MILLIEKSKKTLDRHPGLRYIGITIISNQTTILRGDNTKDTEVHMKRILFCMLFLLVVTVSCSKQEQPQKTPPPTITSDITGAVTTPPLSVPTERPRFVPKEGDTCLTIMCSCFYKPQKEQVDALNWYLQDNGYGFYVEVFAGTALSSEGIDGRYDAIVEAYEQGTKVDLLMLSGGPEDAADAVDRKLVLNLESFLNPDSPEEWVRQIPENYWELVAIGEGKERGIYGLYSSEYMIQSSTIVANESLLSNEGIALSEQLDIQKMDALLKRLDVDDTDLVYPVLMNECGLYIVLGYMGMRVINCEAVLRETEQGFVAENPFESESVMRDMATLYEWYQKGWLGFSSDIKNAVSNGDSAFALVNDSTRMSQCSSSGVYHQEGVKLYPISQAVGATVDMLCIAAWSEHPQEAFQLMKLLYTNEDVANLLYYGQLAEDVEEGSHVSGGVGVYGLMNHLLLNHVLTKEEKELYVEELGELPSIPHLLTTVVMEGKVDQEEWNNGAIRSLFMQDFKSLLRECKSQEAFVAKLEEYRVLLEEDVLYQEMIASWNRQLSDYRFSN